MAEYFEFCKAVYLHNEHSSIFAREKMFCFLYYQAFLEKKKEVVVLLPNQTNPYMVYKHSAKSCQLKQFVMGVGLHDIPDCHQVTTWSQSSDQPSARVSESMKL